MKIIFLEWIKSITINYTDLYKMSFKNSFRCNLVMQIYLHIGILFSEVGYRVRSMQKEGTDPKYFRISKTTFNQTFMTTNCRWNVSIQYGFCCTQTSEFSTLQHSPSKYISAQKYH